MNDECFNCGEPGHKFYGYTVCDSCKKELRLFTDKTVGKYVEKYSESEYREEIKERLSLVEKDFIKKRIKLLDILDKIG